MIYSSSALIVLVNGGLFVGIKVAYDYSGHVLTQEYDGDCLCLHWFYDITMVRVVITISCL